MAGMVFHVEFILDDLGSNSDAEELIAGGASDELDEFSIDDDAVSYPWSGIWEEAEKVYYGLEDSIEDFMRQCSYMFKLRN
jgi:hypothetical protein